jgi:hypothetical protein
MPRLGRDARDPNAPAGYSARKRARVFPALAPARPSSVRLGHENVATTMNLYQHIPVDMARESAQSVADYILG